MKFCKVTALAATALGLGVQPLAAYEKTGSGTILLPPNYPGTGSTTDSSVIIIGDPGDPTPPVLTPPLSWLYHTFTGTNGDGATPVSLVEAGDGYLYGTTAAGGAANAGTLFRINPGATTLQTPVHLTLHSFDGAAGGNSPSGSLARASDGTIYGVTSGGGAYGKGTLFKRDPNGTFSVLHSFGAPADDTHQAGATYPITIMLASDGNIYGLAQRPVSSPGTLVASPLGDVLTLFKATPEGAVSYLGSFGAAYQLWFGVMPPPGIVEAGGGKLYVSAFERLYRWSLENPDANALPLPAGVERIGNLVRTHSGVIYGTALKADSAEIVRIDPLTDSITELSAVFRDIAPRPRWIPPLTTFDGKLDPLSPVLTIRLGGGPVSLIEGGNGALYGLWSQPGGTDYIFSVLLDGTFGTDIVHKFLAAEGRTPATLVRAGGSKLAGVLGSSDSLTSKGTIFGFYPATPTANVPPTAVDDRFTVSDAPPSPAPNLRVLSANVLANDTDADGDTLRVISARSNGGSLIAINEAGTISIPWAGTFDVAPEVTYTIADDRGGVATGKISLQNAPPTASADTVYIAPGNSPAALPILSNDTDPDGDSLHVVSFSAPRYGTLEKTANSYLVYTPKRSFTTEDHFEYTVSDGHGGESHASVRIVNPLLKVSGQYSTLIGRPNAIGRLQLTLSPGGSFTGKLFLRKSTLKFRGAFNTSGAFSKRIKDSNGVPVVIDLQYTVEDNKVKLTGLLVDDPPANKASHAFSFSLARVFTAASSPWAGRYTLVLPATPLQLASALPKGNGYAVMTVTARGAASIVGRLADGAPFSGGANLLTSNTMPVYGRAYAAGNWTPAGITGSLTFADISNVSDVTGAFTWFKPPYPGGILTKISAVGSRYTPPDQLTRKNQLWPNGAMLHMGEGDLDGNIKKRVTVLSATQLEVAPVGTEQVHLSLQPSTGLLSGEFTHPSNGKTSQIGGVVLQKQDRAFGAFAAPDGTGWITIEPRD